MSINEIGLKGSYLNYSFDLNNIVVLYDSEHKDIFVLYPNFGHMLMKIDLLGDFVANTEFPFEDLTDTKAWKEYLLQSWTNVYEMHHDIMTRIYIMVMGFNEHIKEIVKIDFDNLHFGV